MCPCEGRKAVPALIVLGCQACGNSGGLVRGAESGTESKELRALVLHAPAMGLTDLVLTVTEGNASAIRLNQEAGFVAFGTEPRAILVDGHLHGKVHMHLRLG
jgi:L-amino acid N-acyltransferase YncA